MTKEEVIDIISNWCYTIDNEYSCNENDTKEIHQELEQIIEFINNNCN